MNFDTPTVDQLRAMLALHEERANVQRQLDAIDEKLAALQSRIFAGGPARRAGRPTGARVASMAESKVARASVNLTKEVPAKAPRNQFKGRIAEALAAAGEHGASLKELAEKLSTNYRNVAVWFATTGKKNPRIQKIGPARYRLSVEDPDAREEAPVSEESAHSGSLPAPAPAFESASAA